MRSFCLFLLLIFIAGEAWTQCRPRLRNWSSRVDLPTTSNLVAVDFIVNRRRREACQYFITFSRGNSSNFNRFMRRNSSQVSYNIFDTASLNNILKDLPTANSNEVIQGRFVTAGGSDNRAHQYFINRPEQVVKPAGRYVDRLQVNIFEGAFGSTTTPIQTRNLRVRYEVPKEVQLSLVDTGAPFYLGDLSQSMNFGTLTSFESQNFDIVLMSNAGFEVRMSSQNNSRLKHQIQNQFVNYQVSVNGRLQNLSGSASTPVVVAQGSGVSPATGVRLPVAVTIGSIGQILAGRYQDNITVTVATTD